MTGFGRVLLVAGIAIGAAAAAPASAAVLVTGPLYCDDYASAGTYHACIVVNTSTTPLSATSKVEILNSGGAVVTSASLSGLPPGAIYEITDTTLGYYESCRFTVASAKKIKGSIVVYHYDGTKFLTLAQEDAR